MCARDPVVANPQTEDGEIIEGELACASCSQRAPILRGIPRFTKLDQVETEKAATATKFGWQWQHFTQRDELYTDQFLGWIAPVRPEFFSGQACTGGRLRQGSPHATRSALGRARSDRSRSQ